MKHWFVFFLALASVGSVKGQQTITLSNGNMVAGACKQPPTRTVKSVDDGYIITYTFDKATEQSKTLSPVCSLICRMSGTATSGR